MLYSKDSLVFVFATYKLSYFYLRSIMQVVIEFVLEKLDAFGFKSEMTVPLLGSVFIVLVLVIVVLCQKQEKEKDEDLDSSVNPEVATGPVETQSNATKKSNASEDLEDPVIRDLYMTWLKAKN